MGTVASRITVPFAGEGTGTAPMTWAQVGIWKTMVATGINMNIGGTVPMPDGTPVEEMTTLLRYLASRHQSLRTRLRFGPDGSAEQVLSDSGELEFELLDVGPDDDAAAVAERLRARYAAEPFDYEREWPVRMGAVRRGGSLTHVVLMYCHLAVDGFGIDAIVRDMPNLDPATGEAKVQVTALTPFEMAVRQGGGSGHRASEKSLRHWEQVLRAIPQRRLGTSNDPRAPRYWELTLRSPTLRLALQVIAQRTGVGVGHVALAAYAVALARRTGINPSVAQLVVNNRFRPGCGDSVSQLAQLGICAIDVDGIGFDEAVRRAFTAATSANMHAYYDPAGLDEVVARVRAERPELEYDIIVNDRTAFTAPATVGDAPDAERIEAARPLTTTWWSRRVDALDAVLNISFDTTPDAVDVTICADTHRLGPADIEALARELESVAVSAAAPRIPAGAVETAGVRPTRG
ncbi:condensation domain-containing protein [Dactylosporangium sp. CA-233914]|uniref:condensation domain-containing protein n=1 Tax=Dactylosporangium sp. CA-233914 TaxID=3239934 RepID=UPI003D8C4C57